jgi:hypothetical protein
VDRSRQLLFTQTPQQMPSVGPPQLTPEAEQAEIVGTTGGVQ